jgi:hypothetical protein
MISTRALIFYMSIFLVTRPFRRYQHFWPCDLDLGVWPSFSLFFFLNFNLGHNFWMISSRALIFYMNIPCYKTFPLVPTFWPRDLDLSIWHTFSVCHKNFNLGHNFRMISTRALIFYMSIPCDKNFLSVPTVLTSWPWPWCLTYFFSSPELKAQVSFSDRPLSVVRLSVCPSVC